jgi:threonine dehydrogenase-like Zn-dependent dehydrogenase
MGGWIGGQPDYVMVPYAEFNLLKFPEKAHAMEKIRDLTCLSDILLTGIPWSRHRQVRRRIDGLRRRRRAGRALRQPC